MNAAIGMLRFDWSSRVPVVLQAEQSECGLACLAMILGYHGHRLDLDSLRKQLTAPPRGSNLKTLMAQANDMHLDGRPVKLELDELPKLRLPAILHWDLNHFVVLAAIKTGRYRIHDPALGERVLSREALGKHFTGIAMELTPTADFQPKTEIRRLGIGMLWRGVHGLKPSIGHVLVLSLLLQIFALALPFYSQLVIDDVLLRHDMDLLHILALGFMSVTLINAITDLIRSQVVLYLGNQLGFQLAANVHHHLLRLPLDYFQRRHLGDIVSRFSSIHKIRDFITSGIIEAILDGIMVVGAVVLIMLYAPGLSLLVLLVLLCNCVIKLTCFGILRRENEALLAASARENTTLMENIKSMQGIKLFSREGERHALWQNHFAEATNRSIVVQKVNFYLRIARNLLFGIENILIIMLGAYAVIDGSLSTGMLIAFLAYKEQLYKRFFGLVDKYFDYRLLDVHLSRLRDIVFTLPETGPATTSLSQREHHTSETCLELDCIGFRYSKDSTDIFDNLNLQVSNGESIAIIGPTGCGKSTLLKVILGLYPASEGSIKLMGNPLHPSTLAQHRRSIAALLQGDSLLGGSILDNICFFEPVPDRARAMRAAAMAAVAGDIQRLPMAYETLVGNMGADLSSGQVQRILLARMFYKALSNDFPCQLMVLDEATSHLDLDTERQVTAMLRQLPCAQILVSHRPQSLALVDTLYQFTPTGLQRLDKKVLATPASMSMMVPNAADDNGKTLP